MSTHELLADKGDTAPQSPAPSISRGYALYALLIIFAANFFSYLDRQIVGGLEKELHASFHMGGASFGWLVSMFTIGYMVFAPIISKLVVNHNRPRIFGFCVFLWSLATFWSGWATTKPELFAARFLIGIGEAGCLVIGPTLLADYFRKEVRGKVLSVFFLGLPLGGATGYLVASEVPKLAAAYYPEFQESWRAAFYVAGLPGIGLALLVFLLTDPPRGGESVGLHDHGLAGLQGIRPFLDLLKNRTLMLIILAQAFAVIILAPLLFFGVGFLEDKYGMDKGQASISIGGIALVAGCLGNWMSGVIGDRLARHIKGAYALLAGLAYIAGAPLLIVGFTSDSVPVMLAALGCGAFCFFLCMPAVNTQIANSVSHQKRAMAYALAVFILHLLGDTFAPPLFGYASRFLRPHLDPEDIAHRTEAHVLGRQHAFVLFSCALFAAGLCSLLAMRTARRDEDQAESSEKAILLPEGR